TFMADPITSGVMSDSPPMNHPAKAGATAQAPTRTRWVTPDATVRSDGCTTAITYDWRVGTSISTSPSRSRNRRAAIGKLGAYATVISRRLEGIWVKTIVLTSPMRRASHAAPRWDRAFRRRAP